MSWNRLPKSGNRRVDSVQNRGCLKYVLVSSFLREVCRWLIQEEKGENIRHRLAMAGFLMSTAAAVTHPASLECEGNIVSQGDAPQQLLDTCGEPTSRQGSE